jgi:hypothetical protein
LDHVFVAGPVTDLTAGPVFSISQVLYLAYPGFCLWSYPVPVWVLFLYTCPCLTWVLSLSLVPQDSCPWPCFCPGFCPLPSPWPCVFQGPCPWPFSTTWVLPLIL